MKPVTCDYLRSFHAEELQSVEQLMSIRKGDELVEYGYGMAIETVAASDARKNDIGTVDFDIVHSNGKTDTYRKGGTYGGSISRVTARATKHKLETFEKGV